jgi:hypothetical protein
MKPQLLPFLIFLLIISNSCTNQPSTQSYVSNKMGIAFEYPVEWQLVNESDNTLTLEYLVKAQIVGSILIEVRPIGSLKKEGALNILAHQFDTWRRSMGNDNLAIIQEPRIMRVNELDIAIATARLNLAPGDGNREALLRFDFSSQLAVIEHDDKVIIIAAMSPGKELAEHITSASEIIIRTLQIE